jgi:hypothetical protein
MNPPVAHGASTATTTTTTAILVEVLKNEFQSR